MRMRNKRITHHGWTWPIVRRQRPMLWIPGWQKEHWPPQLDHLAAHFADFRLVWCRRSQKTPNSNYSERNSHSRRKRNRLACNIALRFSKHRIKGNHWRPDRIWTELIEFEQCRWEFMKTYICIERQVVWKGIRIPLNEFQAHFKLPSLARPWHLTNNLNFIVAGFRRSSGVVFKWLIIQWYFLAGSFVIVDIIVVCTFVYLVIGFFATFYRSFAFVGIWMK